MLWHDVHALVQRAKSGEREAVDSLYRLTLPYLCRLAQKLLGPGWPEKSVSDLIQQSWMRAWQRIQDFQGADDDANTGALLRAWLARTMKNVQHNDVRFHNAQRRRSPTGEVRLGMPGGDSSSSFVAEPPGRDATPSADMWQAEQRERVEQALLALDNADDAAIVRWRFFDGMSLAEIGRRLGRDESTVRYRLQRILDILSEQLRDWQ